MMSVVELRLLLDIEFFLNLITNKYQINGGSIDKNI